ncbi:MAG: hypothetical protein Q4D96_07805 [Propionibacteriaceae bacterium]|nr:hypothetical protein [Propionibacteriaceae bacterium]
MTSAVDAMPPPDAVNKMRATEVAQALEVVASRLSSCQVAGFSGQVPGWLGEAADAYTESIRDLGKKVRSVATSVGVCGRKLYNWASAVGNAVDSRIPNLHARWDDLQWQYAWKVRRATEALSDPRDPMTQEDFDAKVREFAAYRDAEQEAVLWDYKNLMTGLDELAAQVAREMSAVLDVEIGVEGWTSGGGGRTELATLLFNNLPLVDTVAEYELAQQEAKEAAEYLNGEEPLNAERVLEFHEKYGDRFDDPFFLAGLNEQVSPQQVLQFLSDIDHMRSGPVDVFGAEATTNRYRDVVEELAAGFGRGFVLSAGGFDAGMDSKRWEAFQTARDGFRTSGGLSMTELWQRRAEEWKAAGNERLDLERFNVAHSGPTTTIYQQDQGYEYFGFMLAAAAKRYPGLALGADYFEAPEGGRSVAEDLLIFEKKYYAELEKAQDSSATVTPDRLMPEIMVDGKPVRAGFVEGMLALMDTPELPEYGPGRVPRTWSGFKEADAERFDAVQRFMTGGVPEELDVDGIKGGPMTMTRYLTGNRWSPYHIPPDGGDALGRLLAELSLPHSRPDAPGESEAYQRWLDREWRSATVAAEFFEGYQDGLERSGVQGASGRHPFGDDNKVLRNWAGRIISPYLGGLADGTAIDIDEREGVHVGEDEYRGVTLSFSTDFLARLRREHGVFKDLALDVRVDVNGTPTDPYDDVSPHPNPPAMEVLLAEAMRQYEDDLDWAFSAEGNRKAKVESVVVDWASKLDLLDASATDAAVAQGEAKDEVNRRIKSLASALLGGVKIGKGVTSDKGMQEKVDKAFNAISGGVIEGIFGEGAAAREIAAGKQRHNSLEQTMKQLLMAKFYEGAVLDAGNENDFKAYALAKGYGPEEVPESYFDLIRRGDKREEKLLGLFLGYVKDREGIGEDYKLLLAEVDKSLNLSQQEGDEEE